MRVAHVDMLIWLLAQVKRVHDAIVGTCVVYALGAVAIHSLGLWHGVLQARQDKTGVLCRVV